MEKSFWANDDPVEPVNAARQANTNSPHSPSQHTRIDTNVFQSSSAFQRPQGQPVRMADPNPGPMLHSPTAAAQMSGLNRGMTQASSRNAPPRSRATITSSNQSFQPPSRPDSALGFKPAPLASTATPITFPQAATARSSQAPPTVTVDKAAPAPTSTSSNTMPSRVVPAHHREDENQQLTLRDPSPNGEQWRTQKDNKFRDVLLEPVNIRNRSRSRLSNNVNEYAELDSLSNFKPRGPTLSYDDYAEPQAPTASARTITTTSSANAIKASHEETNNAHIQLKKRQEEQDVGVVRTIEERKVREDAVRVEEEQEQAERAAELNRQHYRDDVHGPQDQATPVAPPTASQSDTAAQLVAALDELLVLTEDLSKTEILLQKGQDRATRYRDKIDVKLEQVRLLRRQQLNEVRLNSAD